MKQLIWYTIPGAVFLFSLGLTVPCITSIISDRAYVLLVIASVPVVGYIIHQFWRTIFEFFGGFQAPYRSTIEFLKKEYTLEDNEHAFLIWETTFYSESFPSSFREHDRGAWHYIMSFWATSFAAFWGLIILFIFQYVFSYYNCYVGIYSIHLGIVAIIFLRKGYLTYHSLCSQEEAIIMKHQSIFDSTAWSLYELHSIALSLHEPHRGTPEKLWKKIKIAIVNLLKELWKKCKEILIILPLLFFLGLLSFITVKSFQMLCKNKFDSTTSHSIEKEDLSNNYLYENFHRNFIRNIGQREETFMSNSVTKTLDCLRIKKCIEKWSVSKKLDFY